MSIPQDANNNYLFLPNSLSNFTQTSVEEYSGGLCLVGSIDGSTHTDIICPKCGNKPHVNGHTVIHLKHLSLGSAPTFVQVRRKQYFCPYCHHSFEESIQFKSHHHLITKPLERYIQDLLAMHQMSISCIARIVHVHREIIKSIDKKRLQHKYHTGKNKFGKMICCYKKPTHYSRFLGIDEFSLHKHHKYATVIMDLETGEVLYVALGKQKQVVYNFIKLFGDEFMKHVVAVASDMNAGYQSAFREHYPHIESIYDHFHLVKNFNDEVIKPIRSEEYQRLLDEATRTHDLTIREQKREAAAILKSSKYLLLSSPDKLGQDGLQKLEQIFNQNQLLYTAEVIKEAIHYAYTLNDPIEMESTISVIVNLCLETDNPHFIWFSRLIQNHLDGIIMHARYHLSTGKVEGTNNKIKTIRRQAYGFRDDEYFFLKIIDSTNKPISHRKM